MTYGEKFKEVFGYYPETMPCPENCPKVRENMSCIEGYECEYFRDFREKEYEEKKVKRMTENERKIMMNLADTIQGEINRMCVTNDLSEFDTMYGYAKKNLEKLSIMIYYSRFKKEGEG